MGIYGFGLWVMFWVVLAPFATLCHELGHAAAVLTLTDRAVSVSLGRRGAAWIIRVGRLSIHLRAFTFWEGRADHDSEGGESTPVPDIRNLLIYLAGPIVSLTLASALWVIDITVPVKGYILHASIRFLISYLVIQFLSTVAPIRYPRWLPGHGGRFSDGHRVLTVLRQMRSREGAV